ncbi:UDP-N-acetylmuramoyl-L-alanyl-D-glutamate--2,6-diaminopimelate ligase [Bacteroidota bacterium]
MTNLNDILLGVEIDKIIGDTDIGINELQFDSRKVKNNDVFFAIPGTAVDGHKFIDNVINSGAAAIICEIIPEELAENICYIRVKNSAEALGIIASNFYQKSSLKLKVIGVTGTNGKTTIATLLYELVKKLGKKAGLISTVEYFVNDKKYESTHTTPDSLRIQQLFAEMVNDECEFCFMEVSSHAIVQGRLAGINFTGGIYTNITHDHLDYHKTFDEYIKAKKQFFDELPSGSFALLNNDDRNSKIMIQNSKADVAFYSLKGLEEFKAKILETHIDGTLTVMDGKELWTSFIGKFNIYNLLAVYACAAKLGFAKEEILKELSLLKPVRGRFEYIKSDDDKIAIVDYAHTPDALVNVLSAINEIRTGNEQVITVVGAGGNRDKTKRPKMAIAAIKNSDKVIYTSDNPRNEDPEQIIKDMLAGVNKSDAHKYLAITDRKEAIKTAIMLAKSKDIILIAGKGHEDYQEVNGVKHHFDDKEVIKEIFNNN